MLIPEIPEIPGVLYQETEGKNQTQQKMTLHTLFATCHQGSNTFKHPPETWDKDQIYTPFDITMSQQQYEKIECH